MKVTAFLGRTTEIACGLLLALALALIQVLVGGTRLLFSLPAYGLVAVAGVLTIFLLRRHRSRPDQLCLTSAVVFFGYVIIRALLSPAPYLARADLYSVLGGLLVYFFVACYFSKTKSRIWLIAFLLCVALVHVAIGAVQFRHGNNFMLIPWLRRFDYGRRASGFYVCPDHLAGMLEVVAIIGLSLVCWSRWSAIGRLLAGYAVAMCYLGIAITGSRGGYLSVLASLLVFAVLSLFVLRKTSPAFFWKMGAASLILAIALAATTAFLMQQSQYLNARAQNIYDRKNIRLDLWAAALQQWQLEPLTGTGSGTYRYYGRQFRSKRVQLDPIEVHNDYLQLLAEYGVAGVLGFAFFLVMHLRRGWRDFLSLGPKRLQVSPRILSNTLALNIGALCAVAALMVHSIFDFNLHIPANVLLLAFVFGLLANSGAQRESEDPKPTAPLILWRLVLPVLSGFVLVACWRLLPGEYFAERARTAVRDHQTASAILFARRGLAVEEQNPNLYLYLGRARMEQGGRMRDSRAANSFYVAALTSFESARNLTPRDETCVLELAFANDALHRFPEAESFFETALKLDPNSDSLHKAYDGHLKVWKAAH